VQLAAQLLHNLDGLQAARFLDAQHGVNRQFGKVVLGDREDLGAQGRPGNVQQVLPERGRIIAIAWRL